MNAQSVNHLPCCSNTYQGRNFNLHAQPKLIFVYSFCIDARVNMRNLIEIEAVDPTF